MRTLDFHRAFGWKWTLVLVITTCGYIAVGAWLSLRLDWPDRYGLHCSGRGCIFKDLEYSPALLRGGTPLEYLLFVWLWLLPVMGIALLILGVWDARRRSAGLVYPSTKYKSE